MLFPIPLYANTFSICTHRHPERSCVHACVRKTRCRFGCGRQLHLNNLISNFGLWIPSTHYCPHTTLSLRLNPKIYIFFFKPDLFELKLLTLLCYKTFVAPMWVKERRDHTRSFFEKKLTLICDLSETESVRISTLSYSPFFKLKFLLECSSFFNKPQTCLDIFKVSGKSICARETWIIRCLKIIYSNGHLQKCVPKPVWWFLLLKLSHAQCFQYIYTWIFAFLRKQPFCSMNALFCQMSPRITK